MKEREVDKIKNSSQKLITPLKVIRSNKKNLLKNSNTENTNLIESEEKNYKIRKLSHENEYLKLKYLSHVLDVKIKNQKNSIFQLIHNISKLLENERNEILNLEKNLFIKQTLLTLLEVTDQNLEFSNILDLEDLESYFKQIDNLLNLNRNTFHIIGLKNGEHTNNLLKSFDKYMLDKSKLDIMREFTENVDKFNLANNDLNKFINELKDKKDVLLKSLNLKRYLSEKKYALVE